MVGFMISIVYVEKRRHREVNSFVQGHTVKSMLEQGPQRQELISKASVSLSTIPSENLIQRLNSLFQEIKNVHFFSPIKIAEILLIRNTYSGGGCWLMYTLLERVSGSLL